jgi:3-hydroxyisobutyrate dehydrogenase-like beta-hydroxyacid dehydrogenase
MTEGREHTMKVGFIGVGRMGQAMARRLLDAKHEVGVYNRTAAKAKPLADAGAKIVSSIADAARYGEATYSMLADDAALEDVVFQTGGLLQSLPKGGIHICAGTHGIPVIRRIKQAHADQGQVLVCAPMMGRPELVSAGTAGVFASGPADAMTRCKPLFDALGRKTFEGGADPEAATAMKIANNFVLGCAIEAMGEGFALTRKYGVETSVFYDVMTDGLFNCSAYKVYGKIMVDESYAKVGQMAVLGLKDANLALEAGGLKGVPLPSGNVWRDRLVGAVAHGDGDKDWAVMALEQARASGLA